MLSRSQTSGRPLPPARIRRSLGAPAASTSTTGTTPPPPYITSTNFAFPAIEENSKPSGKQDDVPLTELNDSNFDWLDGRSREELSDLLLKADDLIKERENELGLASAAVKSLYDSSATLKSQHQTFLARIPPSPAMSPHPSVSSLDQTPHMYTNSLPRSQPDSLNLGYRPHSRKISMSQRDLSLLADQNVELLQKLERLETDSANTDRTGRRVLKKLERDIALLREELDHTQARSEELEEKARAGTLQPLTAQELERRKQDRVARTQALRTSTSIDEGIQDFAPGNPLSTAVTPVHIPRDRHQFRPSESLDSPNSSVSIDSDIISPPSTSLPSHVPSHETNQQPLVVKEGETALISQLLLKIQELEETNNRILFHQEETNHKLLEVQKETEGMSRLYECLNDKEGLFEVEVVDGSSSPSTPEKVDPHYPNLNQATIRFRTLRNTLEADMAQAFTSSSIEDADDDQSNHNFTPKSRKSVMELFDIPQSTENNASPEPFPTREDKYDALSPALSCLSIGTPSNSYTFPEGAPHQKPTTLDSELGGETGTWGLDGDNYHLRTTSLYGINSHLSLPASPSPLPSLGKQMPESMQQQQQPSLKEEGAKTPVITSGLQLSIEPPTPDKKRDSDLTTTMMDSNPGGGAPSSNNDSATTLRYRRMSQTVQGRTAKWVDGRFSGSLSSIFSAEAMGPSLSPSFSAIQSELPSPVEEDPKNIGGLASDNTLKTELPGVVDNAIDVVFDTLQRVGGGGSGPEGEEGEKKKASDGRVDKKKSSVVGMILEIWLWMQFIIIILIFVGAMVHRGPKSVLSDAKSRRAVDRR